MPHGVGIVGAGPGRGRAAPADPRAPERRLRGRPHLRRGQRPGGSRSRARVGARSSSGIDELLADAGGRRSSSLCSPPAEHAESDPGERRRRQARDPVREAPRDDRDGCRRGDRRVPRGRHRAPVGTNHLYDPAWGRAKHHLLAGGHRCGRSRSPWRSRRTAATTTSSPSCRCLPPLPGAAAPTSRVPQVAASVVRQLITGLAVHDLPMLRDLAPVIERVVFARAVAPIGYVVGYRASGIPVRLATVMLPDGADALWRPRDHDRHRRDRRCRSRRRSCTRAAPRCAWDSPTGKRHDLPASTPTTATSPSGARSPTC